MNSYTMDHTVIEEVLGITQDVIWVATFSEEHKCSIYVADSCLTKYGIDRDHLSYNFWQKNIHVAEYDRVTVAFRDALADRTVVDFCMDYRYVGPDHSCYHVRNKMRLSRNSDGQVEKITGVWSDVTDSKKQLDLLQSEFRQVNQQLLFNIKELSERDFVLNQSQQLARIGNWEYDLESQTMMWSDEMYNIFRIGYDFPINSLNKLPELFSSEYAQSIRYMFENLPWSEHLPLDVSAQLNTVAGDQPRWVRITVNADHESGEVKRIVGLVYDITYFKDAEEKLQSSEEKFSKAFNLNPELLFIIRERDKLITEVNGKIMDVYGYTREEMIGRTSQEVNAWVSTDERDAYHETLRKHGAISMEVVQRHKTGGVFLANISAQRVFISGEAYHLVIVQDITKQRQAEEEIRLSEARLNSIINNTDLQVWSVDTQYRIEAMNNVFRQVVKEIFNVDFEVGMNALDIFHEEVSGMVRELYDRAFSGEIVTQETFLKGRFYYSCIHPIISNGRVVGASAYSRDITEQKLVEEKIRSSEANLASMINNTSLFIWSVDIDYKLITFNRQIYDLARDKYALELKIGTSVVSNPNSPEQEKVYEQWTELYNRALTGEIVKFTSEDHERIFNFSLSPIIEQKKVIGVSVFGEDVTENVRREQELRNANKKLGEYKLMALRSVMNPHFIFNALNSIQSFITVNDQVNALNYLSTFSKLMRSILSNSVQNRIRLSEELEQLKHYITLEQLRFQDSFDFVMNIEPNLDLEEIEIPSLLLQPYIENAILHGLYNKRERGKLSLLIREERDSVLFEIEDNGVGREEASRLRVNNFPKHTSMGTALTQERLNLINADGKISCETDDLFHGGRASGTRVRIRVNAETPPMN